MKKLNLSILVLALSVTVIFLNGCGAGSLTTVQGSGIAKTENRNVTGFSKIDASGAVNVTVAIQKDFNLSIEADDNLLPNIKTEVSGDILKIYSDGKISVKTPINVKITMPDIVSLEVSGASSGVVSGSKSDLVIAKASGASKIKIDGEAIKLKADASGASSIDAENFKVEDVDIDASGASSATVLATEELHANASGASKIFYVGEPKRIQKNASDVSSISKK